MRKGQLTREQIIEKAAGLFNSKGFAGTLLSDIMEATGLQKGGIYRHFESKEELASEAFAFARKRFVNRLKKHLRGTARRPGNRLGSSRAITITSTIRFCRVGVRS